MRFFITLSYHGKSYHGWQKQPNAVTVQETVENCFYKIFQEKVKLVGAGRTDTGVHARQFIAHFDLDTDFNTQHLVYKLNRMLPADISVKALHRVASDAHARFDALTREYKYYISTQKDPFKAEFSALVKRKINIEAMNQAADLLKSHRDFQCFSKVKTDVKTYHCHIKTAYWKREGNQLVFTIVANRFLRNMVRAIVGTLLEIGIGQRSLEDLKSTLESKNRNRAGKSVVAKGLFLHRIEYPKSITKF